MELWKLEIAEAREDRLAEADVRRRGLTRESVDAEAFGKRTFLHVENANYTTLSEKKKHIVKRPFLFFCFAIFLEKQPISGSN